MAKITTEEIFVAAHTVLCEKGFEKVRLADVARQLGISHAALYKHFASKDDLFDSMIRQWLDEVDNPVLEDAIRAPKQERVVALHDWLHALVYARQEAFSADPEMMAYYEEMLAKQNDLLNPRLRLFAASVEKIMGWDTFKHQRGLTIMLAFTYFYHPFFADKWDDNLFQTLYESTWLEMLPIIQQNLDLDVKKDD